MPRPGVRRVGRLHDLPSTCRLPSISSATALGPVLFGDFPGTAQPSDRQADTTSAYGLGLPGAAHWSIYASRILLPVSVQASRPRWLARPASRRGGLSPPTLCRFPRHQPARASVIGASPTVGVGRWPSACGLGQSLQVIRGRELIVFDASLAHFAQVGPTPRALRWLQGTVI